MTKKLKIISALILIVIVVILIVKNLPIRLIHLSPLSALVNQTTKTQDIPAPVNDYYTFTITKNDAGEEIAQKFGTENVATIIKLNRINSQFIEKGEVLTIPNDMSDFMNLSPFPYQLSVVAPIPKVLLFSQRVQAFGVYEYGELKRWGPISSGKESTQTPSKLYFANWKSEESISTVDPEWILKWNFNLDNLKGIDMHEYELPGYPASHSCVRMFGRDAKWIYYWADQWRLSNNEETLLKYGTPVILFGGYEYSQTAPWKNLPTNAQATTLTKEEIEKEITKYIPEIIEKKHLK